MAPYPAEVGIETESSISGSVLTVDDPEAASAGQQMGCITQALLRKYMPQFYSAGQDDGTQAQLSISLPAFPNLS